MIQRSSICSFTIGVTEENVCTPSSSRRGFCTAVKGHTLKWSAFASSVLSATKLLNQSGWLFGSKFAAFVYSADLKYLKNAAHKAPTWKQRLHDALFETTRHHGFAFDPNTTIVIRTRWDMRPTSFVRLRPSMFYHSNNGIPIMYTSDRDDCQPDMFLYTTLGVFTRHKPHWMGSLCPQRIGLYKMESNWRLCARNLLRVVPTSSEAERGRPNTTAMMHEIQLRPPKLYCNCNRSKATSVTPGFRLVKHWWSQRVYMLSKSTVYACPGDG